MGLCASAEAVNTSQPSQPANENIALSTQTNKTPTAQEEISVDMAPKNQRERSERIRRLSLRRRKSKQAADMAESASEAGGSTGLASTRVENEEQKSSVIQAEEKSSATDSTTAKPSKRSERIRRQSWKRRKSKKAATVEGLAQTNDGSSKLASTTVENGEQNHSETSSASRSRRIRRLSKKLRSANESKQNAAHQEEKSGATDSAPINSTERSERIRRLSFKRRKSKEAADLANVAGQAGGPAGVASRKVGNGEEEKSSAGDSNFSGEKKSANTSQQNAAHHEQKSGATHSVPTNSTERSERIRRPSFKRRKSKEAADLANVAREAGGPAGVSSKKVENGEEGKSSAGKSPSDTAPSSESKYQSPGSVTPAPISAIVPADESSTVSQDSDIPTVPHVAPAALLGVLQGSSDERPPSVQVQEVDNSSTGEPKAKTGPPPPPGASKSAVAAASMSCKGPPPPPGGPPPPGASKSAASASRKRPPPPPGGRAPPGASKTTATSSSREGPPPASNTRLAEQTDSYFQTSLAPTVGTGEEGRRASNFEILKQQRQEELNAQKIAETEIAALSPEDRELHMREQKAAKEHERKKNKMLKKQIKRNSNRRGSLATKGGRFRRKPSISS